MFYTGAALLVSAALIGWHFATKRRRDDGFWSGGESSSDVDSIDAG